jgi:hypothetical protein
MPAAVCLCRYSASCCRHETQHQGAWPADSWWIHEALTLRRVAATGGVGAARAVGTARGVGAAHLNLLETRGLGARVIGGWIGLIS